jgi:hypothetical protein
MREGSLFPAAFPELSAPAAEDLGHRLARAAAAEGPVTSVRRDPLEATWYRTEVVTVELGPGAVARFFLKDFGSFARAKSNMEARRERERFFYKEVFPGGELGLPAYVADVWDGHTWLVLEMVDGAPLSWHELDLWHRAAAWLGGFQSAVVDRMPELVSSGRFTTHGPRYFARIGTRAVAGAGEYDPELARRVNDLLPRYEEHAATLMRHPQTLVHGGFRPAQVLVSGDGDSPRICPTDWEISAVGSCLYDLATLADGFEGAEAEAFLEHFAAEAPWVGAAPAPGDLQDALAACRMHRTMKWIAHAYARGMPLAKTRALVDSLEAGGRA